MSLFAGKGFCPLWFGFVEEFLAFEVGVSARLVLLISEMQK